MEYEWYLIQRRFCSQGSCGIEDVPKGDSADMKLSQRAERPLYIGQPKCTSIASSVACTSVDTTDVFTGLTARATGGAR